MTNIFRNGGFLGNGVLQQRKYTLCIRTCLARMILQLFPCIHSCVFLLCVSVCGGGGGGGGGVVLPSTAGWSHIFMTGFIDYNWGYIFNRVTRMGLHNFGILAVRIFW